MRAKPVPDHPGPRLPSHHAGQLRLEAPPGLEDVLLQRQDGGGEEDLQQVRGRRELDGLLLCHKDTAHAWAN